MKSTLAIVLVVLLSSTAYAAWKITAPNVNYTIDDAAIPLVKLIAGALPGGFTIAATQVASGLLGPSVQTSSVAVGSINSTILGYERVATACGAGVTTCTASCTAGKVALGGSCNAALGLSLGTLGVASYLCTTLGVDTITSTVVCVKQ